MLDKVKQEQPIVQSIEIVDGMAYQKWEPFIFCGMQVKMVSKHEIISLYNDYDVNHSELETADEGEAVTVEICLDNDELMNAFNGHWELGINDLIERLTNVTVTNDTEFSS